nr:unnamed protein product [Digitaria exilis]
MAGKRDEGNDGVAPRDEQQVEEEEDYIHKDLNSEAGPPSSVRRQRSRGEAGDLEHGAAARHAGISLQSSDGGSFWSPLL